MQVGQRVHDARFGSRSMLAVSNNDGYNQGPLTDATYICRCDDLWPSCSNCQKVSATCDKVSIGTGNDEPTLAYIKSLEEKVANLETQISHPDCATKRTSADHHEQQNSPPNALGEVVDALSHGNFEAPAYVGSSSGFSLALNLGSMVQASVWNEALPNVPRSQPRGNMGSPTSLASESMGSTARPITIEEVVSNSAEPPDDDLGARLLDVYCAQLHQRYPFLNTGDLWKLHSERFALRARAIVTLSRAERFGIFKLYMVYAIGAMVCAQEQ